MNQRGRRFEWVLWAGLLLVIATIFLAYLLAQLRVRTFLGEPLPVYGQVADFMLTNQAGHAVSLADLRGHAWVADIIFTRCAGPCLKMSRLMKELQDALPPSSNAKLISLTTDPDYDTPAILKAYGQRFGANPGRWLFLTGSKKEISALAINSLKLTTVEKQPQERESPVDLFVHSTIFVVVDPRGQLRGVFETTGEGIDAQQVKTRLQAALRRLERER
jgi:cytochrome oxidase Cu insertion factor (SCO1/SenC/PrrC family)